MSSQRIATHLAVLLKNSASAPKGAGMSGSKDIREKDKITSHLSHRKLMGK
jgi:hypothetical protein